MIKKFLLGLMLLLAPTMVRCTTVQLTGTLVDASGTPLNGQVCLQLPANAVDTSVNRALTTNAVCFPVNNGVLPSFANIVPTDVMQPQNLYYRTLFKNSAGTVVFVANYSIPTAGGTFNLGLAVPTTITTSNISYISPALLNVTNIFTAAQTFPINSIVVNYLVAGSNGTCLETLSSVVQWVACNTVGTQVTINGGSFAANMNFGNLPAAGANNLLGVWQTSAGNASVEIPVTGTGAKAISGTGTYTAGHGLSIDANSNIIDNGFQGGLNQYFSVSGCTTATSTDSSCTGTITLPTAYADASYFPIMTPNSVNGAFISVSVSGSLSAGSFPYTLTCSFNCGTIVTPTIYVYTHHN